MNDEQKLRLRVASEQMAAMQANPDRHDWSWKGLPECAVEAADALIAAIERTAQPEPKLEVTEEMVQRFLGWRLPDTFAPDCYISFDRNGIKQMGNGTHWPVGTNLLNDLEARAMLEYVLGTDSAKPVPVEAAPHYMMDNPVQTSLVQLEDWALQGGVLTGDDASRFRALADRIAPAPKAEAAPAKHPGWVFVDMDGEAWVMIQRGLRIRETQGPLGNRRHPSNGEQE